MKIINTIKISIKIFYRSVKLPCRIRYSLVEQHRTHTEEVESSSLVSANVLCTLGKAFHLTSLFSKSVNQPYLRKLVKYIQKMAKNPYLLQKKNMFKNQKKKNKLKVVNEPCYLVICKTTLSWHSYLLKIRTTFHKGD